MIWLMLFGRIYGLIYATFGGYFLLSAIGRKQPFYKSVMRYCFGNELYVIKYDINFS